MAKNKEEKNKKFDIPLVALLVLPTVIFFFIYFLYCEKSDIFFKISSESYSIRCEEFYATIDNNKSSADAKAELKQKDLEAKKENISQKSNKQDAVNPNNPNQEIITKDYSNPVSNTEENKSIEENSSASIVQSAPSRSRANQGKGGRMKRKTHTSNFNDI